MLLYIGSFKLKNKSQFGSEQRNIDHNILNDMQNINLNDPVNISDSNSQLNINESCSDLNMISNSFDYSIYNDLRDVKNPLH